MNKFKTVLAFTLVIFFVSLCVPTLFGQGPQRSRRPMLQNQSRAGLNVPDLTDEQKEQLKNLRENQREVQEQFMSKTKNFHLELNELKKDSGANAGKIEKIQDEIFNLRIEQMKTAYMHQKEIKKIFTPEQLEKMSSMRKRALRNQIMRRGQNRGRMSGRNRVSQRGNMWRRR
ncbi:MAG: Spy/CpxP family protein refolding chaperone [Candidatus Aminicenantes bacterium]|nr:Spy/CpxP family protein refolding chaperone [Candidatus Aminicenantes bacterium]